MAVEQLALQNEGIRAVFSAASGALLQIEDRARDFSHLQGYADAVPFRVERGGRLLRAFRSFSYQKTDTGRPFTWRQFGGVEQHAG